MTEKKSENWQKVYKILNQKNTHTGPTNSAGKSFPNTSEFALLAFGKGLVAQSVKP